MSRYAPAVCVLPGRSVLLVLGNSSEVALCSQWADMARAEESAASYLGREWGDDREISVAQFFTLDPSGSWVFDSEMEY